MAVYRAWWKHLIHCLAWHFPKKLSISFERKKTTCRQSLSLQKVRAREEVPRHKLFLFFLLLLYCWLITLLSVTRVWLDLASSFYFLFSDSSRGRSLGRGEGEVAEDRRGQPRQPRPRCQPLGSEASPDPGPGQVTQLLRPRPEWGQRGLELEEHRAQHSGVATLTRERKQVLHIVFIYIWSHVY